MNDVSDADSMVGELVNESIIDASIGDAMNAEQTDQSETFPLEYISESESATAVNSSLGETRIGASIVDEESDAKTGQADLTFQLARSATPEYISLPAPTITEQAQRGGPLYDNRLNETVSNLLLDRDGHVAATRLLLEAAAEGRYSNPLVVSKVMKEAGRLGGDPQVVEQLYLLAYHLLPRMDPYPDGQMQAWIQLEDDALIAMANLGLLDRVSQHRDRLIAAGAAPSADAYGSMILNARDTTDDATVAIELFEEARRLGVVPNTFLFNNLISRLSKARRASAVLQVFEQMKVAGVLPSAVTYGAVINACCKVGDIAAASYLFTEMQNLRDFVPRVPPYNTMMQYFVNTAPDRQKALSYFHDMIRRRVQPSEHTYKLLLDCYGTIEPVDNASLKDVFTRLQSDPKVKVQGVHWSALINSHGCIQNNLEEAQRIFESASAAQGLPDAVCYEAILNACLHNGEPGLVEAYADRMKAQKLHSTAYVESARIKAYAALGKLDEARSVFDNLQDPPSGSAAPGNHPGGGRRRRGTPHFMSSQDPVFREPSTFDAMIRIEKASGNVERAQTLYQMATTRSFPVAVIDKLKALL